MNDISRKAKRVAHKAENKARTMKDAAQQKLDDILPGHDKNDSSTSHHNR